MPRLILRESFLAPAVFHEQMVNEEFFFVGARLVNPEFVLRNEWKTIVKNRSRPHFAQSASLSPRIRARRRGSLIATQGGLSRSNMWNALVRPRALGEWHRV